MEVVEFEAAIQHMMTHATDSMVNYFQVEANRSEVNPTHLNNGVCLHFIATSVAMILYFKCNIRAI